MPFPHFFSKSYRRFFASLTLLALALPASAASLTLNEAIGLALKREPELRATGARLEAAHGQAQQAGRWPNPELNLSMEDWPVRDPGWNGSKRLAGVQQTVPFPGKKRLERQIGSAGVRISEAELALRRAETVRATKAAFFQVLAAENLVKEGRALVETAGVLATAAKKRVDAGAAPEQEAARAEIPVEKARLELSDYERDLAMARKTLVTLLARPDLENATLCGTLAEVPVTSKPTPNALPDHPSQTAAQAGIQRAQLEVSRARLEPYPDITVGVGAGQEAGASGAIGEVRVGIPLPLWDNASGKRREARANLSVAEAEADATRLRLEREWNAASAKVRTAAEQARRYRESILPKAQQALRKTQAGYEEGKTILTDLLDTQQTAAAARIAYQQKLLELNLAQADLEALLGKLD